MQMFLFVVSIQGGEQPGSCEARSDAGTVRCENRQTSTYDAQIKPGPDWMTLMPAIGAERERERNFTGFGHPN